MISASSISIFMPDVAMDMTAINLFFGLLVELKLGTAIQNNTNGGVGK